MGTAVMNDTQLISVAITVLAILTGSVFNNIRISDMAGRFSDVNRHTDDMAALLRAEMQAERAELRSEFERTNDKIDSLLKLVA